MGNTSHLDSDSISLILSHCLFAAAITDRVFRLGTNFTLTCIDDGNNGNHALSVSFIVDDHILGSKPENDEVLRNRGIDWKILLTMKELH